MAWTWSWHAHPEVWALVAVLGTAYVVALRRVGPSRVQPGEPVSTPKQRNSAILALLTLLVASEWPVHDLAEGYLYSVHMVQHLLLSLILPPLVIRAMPPWMFRALLPGRAMRVVRRLARPFVALVIFNVVIVATHWPLMVELATRSEAAHFLQHFVLVGAGALMWMPIVSPVLEIPRLAYPGQMLYLFLQSLVPTVPASFLTFGARPLYHVYETFPRVYGISALSDMRVAGLIMKLGGGAIIWAAITIIFFRWGNLEETTGVDALEWTDVDRTVNRMELTNG
ncbi:MAG TPA: cytochrome c oxidase assembly protein [Actinomycetota bacterium]